ncbi:hypothetical protein F4803DRAFT_539692 [Xylaria telfairii]|nr:hypothetical protein F4803DRAFT_539692 [Xylaria telfairii]
MASNQDIMSEDEHHGPYTLRKRVKTDQFPEKFARDIDKRKVPVILPSPCNNSSLLPMTKKSSRFRLTWRNILNDEENPPERERSEPQREWIPPWPIRLSYYRLRYRGPEDILLGIESDGRSVGSNGLLWIETPDYDKSLEKTNPFKRFVDMVTQSASVSARDRREIRDWLLSLESEYSQEEFSGQRLLPMVTGIRLRRELRTSEPLNCLFFCFPYFQLSSRDHFEPSDIPRHSIRPLVQSLYRSESPFNRELSQAAQKLNNDGRIIYVPQFWGLLIDDDYIATYSPSQLHSRPGGSILIGPSPKFPPSFRLLLQEGPPFCVYWNECPTWFDFLLRVHRICSQVFEEHISAEECSYFSVKPVEIIDAIRWPDIVAKRHQQIFDIVVCLPAKSGDHPDQNDAEHPLYVDDHPNQINGAEHPLYVDGYGPRKTMSLSKSDMDQAVRYRLARRVWESSTGPIPLCTWPGCHGDPGLGTPLPKYIISSLFWPPPSEVCVRNKTREDTAHITPTAARASSPLESTNPEEAAGDTPRNFDIPPYFYWKFYSFSFEIEGQSTPSDRRSSTSGQPVHARGDKASVKEPCPWAQRSAEIEQVTGSIHDELISGAIYASQDKMTAKDVSTLIGSFPPEIPAFRRLGVDAMELARHFIGTGINCELEMKFWGALYSVLRVGQYLAIDLSI